MAHQELKEFPFVKGLDYISGLTKHTLSFFLKYFLPTERISDLQQTGFFESINKTLNEYLENETKAISEIMSDIVTSGSAAEGLSVPVFYDRRTGKGVWNSDFDMLRVMQWAIVTEDKPKEWNDGSKVAYCAEPAARPGFVKIYASDDGPKQEYLSSKDWETLKIVRDLAGSLCNPNFAVNPHGPAFTATSGKLRIEIDNVYALKCPTWPKFASKWTLRQHTSGWLERKTVQEIISYGCHFVAVGHPSSPERHLEWRTSFSLAEKKIAQCLSPFQKKAYVIFKILHREFFSFPKVIATYHLKTILFWMCEKLPKTFWSDSNMAECILALLHYKLLHSCILALLHYKLIHCLACCDIPNFFIPENNMINHIHTDFIKTILTKVVKIREDPLKFLLEFDQKFRLFRGPRKPWKASLSLLLSIEKAEMGDCELAALYAYFLEGIANMMAVQSGRTGWGIAEACFFLKESWMYHQFQTKRTKDVPSLSLVRYLCLAINKMFENMSYQPTFVSIQVLTNLIEYVLDECEEDSEKDVDFFCNLHSTVAILHHCLAFWSQEFDCLPNIAPLSKEEKATARINAEIHHNAAIALCPENEGIKTEFAKLLYQNNQFTELISLVEPLLVDNSDDLFKLRTQVTKVEIPTLEEYFQKIAKSTLNIYPIPLVIPNVIVAYYYVCLSHIKLGTDKLTLRRLIQKFKTAADHKMNGNNKVSSQLWERVSQYLDDQ